MWCSTRHVKLTHAMNIITAFYFIFTVSYNVESARILGLFPHVGKSHFMVYHPLLKRLAERGHQVTVVSFFPTQNPPDNYNDVSLAGIAKPGVESVDLSYFENPNKWLRLLSLDKIVSQILEFNDLADLALGVCSKLVKFQPLAHALKKNYDLVLVEYFNSDCVLGLAHFYGLKAPFIALSSCVLMQWSPHRIGLPSNPAYVPMENAYYTSKMTFRQRVENVLLTEYYKVWYRYAIQLKEQAMIEKQFGKKIVDLEDLGKNVSMMLVNVFHSLNGVQPLLPGVVEVGGMHLDHTRKSIPAVSIYF